MQWTPGPQAGFSTDPQTWLPIPSSYKTVNVETESADPASLLNWNKKLIRMRRNLPALHDGDIVMLDSSNPNVLSYLRTAPNGASIVVALNMSAQPQTVNIDLAPAIPKQTTARTVLADAPMDRNVNLKQMVLPPFSSWIGEVRN
jgi:alpha-glucosidase